MKRQNFKTSLKCQSHETTYLRQGALGVLIPSLTTTSPYPWIFDKTSTSGFLVAFNKLLGGHSQQSNEAMHNEKNHHPMSRGFDVWHRSSCQLQRESLTENSVDIFQRALKLFTFQLYC